MKRIVSRFLAGFLAASLLWAAAGYAYLQGYLPFHPSPLEVSSQDEGAFAGTAGRSGGRGRRLPGEQRSRRPRPGGGEPQGRILLTGDDLGEDEVRSVDMVGASGEGQLASQEVELGIDSVMPRIRRCLILVDDEDPITGNMVFGMRIGGSGRVTRVNLRGPSPLVSGEAGSCLREALGSIQYRGFDGPDMVVNYPFTVR